MNIELAKPDEVDMLFIGNLHFTFENPGPFEIREQDLTPAEANAIIYNVRRGVLKVDDYEALKKLVPDAPFASEQYCTPEEAPIPSSQPIDLDGYLKKQLADLKNFLKGKITEVKKNAVNLPPEEVRKLLELEKEGKSRKKLTSFLQELLDKHQETVANRVGDEDLAAMMPSVGNLDNVTDVVESEIIEVDLTADDIEKGKNLLEQEILNPLDG